MGTATIPVDLRNPGQVFACLGLMEAADILLGPAVGGFRWQRRETAVTFTLATPGEGDPVRAVLDFLSKAEAVALRPGGMPDMVAKEQGVRTEPFADDRHTFPCPPPDTPSALPARLEGPGGVIPLSHWADGSHVGRDNVKFWAGAGGGIPGPR